MKMFRRLHASGVDASNQSRWMVVRNKTRGIGERSLADWSMQEGRSEAASRMVSWQAAASVLPSCNDLLRKKNIPQYSAVYITETEEEFTLYRHVTTSGGGESEGHSQARAYLQRFLQENAVHLQTMLSGYVLIMGLATGVTFALAVPHVF